MLSCKTVVAKYILKPNFLTTAIKNKNQFNSFSKYNQLRQFSKSTINNEPIDSNIIKTANLDQKIEDNNIYSIDTNVESVKNNSNQFNKTYLDEFKNELLVILENIEVDSDLDKILLDHIELKYFTNDTGSAGIPDYVYETTITTLIKHDLILNAYNLLIRVTKKFIDY